MAKIEQALILDPPAELHFKGPLTDFVTTSFLTLTNPTDRPVCFKVKTTAPKTYCVRPNSGLVPPKEAVVVAIMLQPVDMEFADRNKHKFMVQTLFAPEGNVDQESLWRNALPENLMNSKLRCVFDEAKDTIQTAAEITEQSKEESEKVVKKERVLPSESEKTPHSQNSGVDATVQNLMNSNKKLKEELYELVQENSRLKEEGLRLRVGKSGGFSVESQSSDTFPGSKLQQMQNSDGSEKEMPHKYFLLIICILAFLIGIYLGKKMF